jgi:hypothetical protein
LNSDSSKIVGYSYFEIRKVAYPESSFYHIEFFKQRYSKMIDSYISPKKLVCYFRVYDSDNTIKIMNSNTLEFFDLNSETGRHYFQKCLISDPSGH